SVLRSSAATMKSYTSERPDPLVVPHVTGGAGAQKTVSIGAAVTCTGDSEVRPAAASCPTSAASAAVKLDAPRTKPRAPRPPKAPNGTVMSLVRVGPAGWTSVPATAMSAPSLPGQVAVVTRRPAARSRTQSGSAVGAGLGPSGLSW